MSRRPDPAPPPEYRGPGVPPAPTPSRPGLPPGRLEERFAEYKPPYSRAEAVAEANRCLYCADAPCVVACPTDIDVPTFIRKIATGNVTGAARTILGANLLGRSCAQVCPVEVLCAGACVYNRWGRDPIQIGRLQRYAVETALEREPRIFTARPATGRKIALVGGGPASIAAAGWLALEGHACTVFERKKVPGGLNTLGIAPYKMKSGEALEEIGWVFSLGDIRLESGAEVVEADPQAGQVAAADLLARYDGVFLGLGLGADVRLRIPGEDGSGVVGATGLIERIKADPSLKLTGVSRAVVIGGGNTSLDVLHELSLLGIETTLVYRRSGGEMPGYAHELKGARRDGGRFVEDHAPVEIARQAGAVSGVTIVPSLGGRPVAGATAEFLPCDLVVVAIGQNRATRVALAFPGVVVDAKGRVVVDPATHRTGNPRVWAGGDCVNGGKEVVNAAAEAKIAVRDINAVLAAKR